MLTQRETAGTGTGWEGAGTDTACWSLMASFSTFCWYTEPCCIATATMWRATAPKRWSAAVVLLCCLRVRLQVSLPSSPCVCGAQCCPVWLAVVHQRVWCSSQGPGAPAGQLPWCVRLWEASSSL